MKGRETLHKWRNKQMKKHRSPNKWRGNRQTTWKRIQNNDSKDDQKPWKQNGGNATINKDLEELKNKHAETAQLMKLKIL